MFWKNTILLPHSNKNYWEKVKNILSQKITSSVELDSLYSEGCLFFQYLEKSYNQEFKKFLSVLPYLKQYAIDSENFLPPEIDVMAENDNDAKLVLTRGQAACLFFFSFLGLMPLKTSRKFNFFNVKNIIENYRTNYEFGRCFVNYLTNIGNWLENKNPYNILGEKITYYRNSITPKEAEIIFQNENIGLCEINIYEKGSMFNRKATYAVDFANRYIGGGVLRGGCVQEEILFATHPELICSMAFMEVMGPNDAIRIDNAIKYSESSGYNQSFCFKKNAITQINEASLDGPDRIIAMDAVVEGRTNQFDKRNIKRDIHKAFVCFHLINFDKNDKEEKSVSTGNWGCGAFGGDHELKFIQQWIAASFAGVKRLDYYTSNKPEMKNISLNYQYIRERYKNAYNLYNTLIHLNRLRKGNVLKSLLS